jgi:GT2 family glycosyltransferase
VALIDVLIPTYRRKTGLAMVLTSLLGQTFRDFDVVVSDQTPAGDRYSDSPEIETVVGALRWRGHNVRLLQHLPPRGLAEHRQFLLSQAGSPYVHFLDDDLVLEPEIMERMVRVIEREECGFVGCPAAGLGFLDDVRPHEQNIEFWHGPVKPEQITPASIPWERHRVNNAANPLHIERRLGLRAKDEPLRYRVAWVGANVLYDRAKLLEVGGFSWWDRLPPNHAGEEAVAQFLLLQAFGGCGILPAGTYHIGLPTTVPDRQHNCTSLFSELLEEWKASAFPRSA